MGLLRAGRERITTRHREKKEGLAGGRFMFCNNQLLSVTTFSSVWYEVHADSVKKKAQ